jgi:hypothetical protein
MRRLRDCGDREAVGVGDRRSSFEGYEKAIVSFANAPLSTRIGDSIQRSRSVKPDISTSHFYSPKAQVR